MHHSRQASRTRRASLPGTCRLPGSSCGLAARSVVLLLLIIVKVGLLEYLRHQGFIDRCRAEKVSLRSRAIGGLFHCEQFLGNARRISATLFILPTQSFLL